VSVGLLSGLEKVQALTQTVRLNQRPSTVELLVDPDVFGDHVAEAVLLRASRMIRRNCFSRTWAGSR